VSTPTATAEPGTGQAGGSRDTGAGPRWRRLVQPLAVLVVVLAVVVYVGVADLNATERTLLNHGSLWSLTLQHIRLTFVTAVIVVAVALPAGIVLTRSWARSGRPGAVGLANVGQAAPSVGLLVLFLSLLGPGFSTAIVGLAVYGILPTLINTMTGLEQVDRNLVEAGRGMGMTGSRTLLRVELPLAVPVILTGIRLSLVLIVGTAALATFIGAGGLGTYIVTGVNLGLDKLLVVGAVMIAALALVVDWLGRLVEDFARPKGLS
jgi:osmoprotectant transport system permease protein